MKFNRKFKEIRQILGATQEEMAKLIEVSQQTINNWEREKRELLISSQMMDRLHAINSSAALYLCGAKQDVFVTNKDRKVVKSILEQIKRRNNE